MNVDGFSDEQMLLADSVQRYIRKHGAVERGRAAACGPNAIDAWNEIAELGWLGVAVREEDGGFGRSGVDMAIVCAGFGQGLLTEPFLPTAIVGASLISSGGASKDLLSDLIGGKLRVAFADSEPGDSYGAAPRTSLEQTPSGLTLTGAKSLVVGVAEADEILVTATRSETARIAVLRLRNDRPDIGRTERRLVDGRLVVDLCFSSIPVDEAGVLIEGEEAARELALACDKAAVANAAESVGVMRGTLAATREHLITRQQFGAPLASFQALQHRYADMVAELELSDSVTFGAARALDAPDTAQRSRMASVARLRTMKAGRLIGESAVQLHGGMGVTAECLAGQYYKRAFVLQTHPGDRAYHLNRVAADLR